MSVSGIGVLYFLIIVVANAVGSVSGMGGGVIIKPVNVSDGTQSLGVFHGDANANKGFSRGVGYCSRYFQMFLC